jgi:hypothetical protein
VQRALVGNGDDAEPARDVAVDRGPGERGCESEGEEEIGEDDRAFRTRAGEI